MQIAWAARVNDMRDSLVEQVVIVTTFSEVGFLNPTGGEESKMGENTVARMSEQSTLKISIRSPRIHGNEAFTWV